MLNGLVVSILLLAGIVNLLPGSGVVSVARLETLYGVPVGGSDLAILLRHRAVLFAIVGGLLIAATFEPRLRSAAIAAGLVSMVSFIVIAAAEGGGNARIATIVRVDIVASLLLGVAALLNWKALP